MTTGRGHPGVILGAVEAALRSRGLTRLYGAACAVYGVLSVALDITVWCDGHRIWWARDGGEETWAASDPDGAASRLAEVARGER